MTQKYFPKMFARVWVFASTLGFSGCAVASIYCYKDASGVMHFSNDPTHDSRYKLCKRIAVPAVAKNAGIPFVTAKLAYGATIEIPRSWQVGRGKDIRLLETVVGSAIDLAGYARQVEGTESLLVTSFPDPQLYAGAVVTSTALSGSTRSSASALSEAQLREGELIIQQGINAVLAQLGGKAWGWTPLKPITVGGTTALHISYLRSSDAGNRRVHIYKFYGTGRIYDVALSTNVAAEQLNNVVLMRIAESFSAP